MVKNTSIFSENANRIQHILPRLQAGTVQMVKAYDFGNLERANALAAENELLAERLILAYRAIPICMAASKGRRIVEKNMADTIPVEIGFTEEGWFSVRIPRLLPRKERGSDDYIRGFLYACKYSTASKCITIYGISQGKKHANDIRPSCEFKIQVREPTLLVPWLLCRHGGKE